MAVPTTANKNIRKERHKVSIRNLKHAVQQKTIGISYKTNVTRNIGKGWWCFNKRSTRLQQKFQHVVYA
jgi:hypothetical protein